MFTSRTPSTMSFVLALLITVGIPLSAQAGGRSNKRQVRAGIAQGGWRVAYGKEIDSMDFVEGAIATYYGGTVGLKLWLSHLIVSSQQELAENVRSELGAEVQREITGFAESHLKRLLKGKSAGSETKQFGGFDVKAGVAHYKWQEIAGGVTLYTVDSFQPYLAMRLHGDEQTRAASNARALEWFNHSDYSIGRDERDSWKGPYIVGTGWTGIRHAFSGGGGVIYAVLSE